VGAYDDAERVPLDSPRDWGDWLAEHHASSTGVWLVTWKARSGRATFPIPAYTKESLRFGWIDSVPRKAGDPDRTMFWCAPRRPRSGWSALNKRLVAELEEEGRLEPAGRALIEAAVADGSWTLLDEVEAGVAPDDLAAAFDAEPGSREAWEQFPWSASRGMLEWLVTARRDTTRADHIRRIVTEAAEGRRALG
jgi:uncharacterized protein YdeI (YjbR/CyaY-like superfamily)